MKFFTTPNSKNIIAILRIVTLEKYELKFLLILFPCLYFLGLDELEVHFSLIETVLLLLPVLFLSLTLFHMKSNALI